MASPQGKEDKGASSSVSAISLPCPVGEGVQEQDQEAAVLSAILPPLKAVDAKEDPAQETAIPPEATSNAPSSPLLNIPPELLLQIAGNLDPLDLQALRIVCRSFLHQLARPSWMDWATTSNLFAFATMLDRNGFLRTTRTCSACRTLHAKPCFSAAELAQDPRTRSCEGSKRRLYFRPGYLLSAQELRSKFEEVLFGMRQMDAVDEWSCTTDPVPILRQDAEESNGYILQTITLMECARLEIPRQQDVASFLRRFNVPICPHTRTGDQAVLKQYFLPDPTEEYTSSVPDTPSLQAHDGCCAAPGCMTSYTFSLWEPDRPGKGNHFLVLCVIREVGNLEDPIDGSWWAQTLQPEEQDEDVQRLEQDWAESDKFRQAELQRGAVSGVPWNWSRWASTRI